MEGLAATEVPSDPTTDPEYQQTLEEQTEIAAVEQEIAREAIKAGVDVAGLIDPTPTAT